MSFFLTIMIIINYHLLSLYSERETKRNLQTFLQQK